MTKLGQVRFAWLVVVACMAASPALAFKSGGWQGEATRDESGKFSACTMTAGYRSGITLAFVITRDFRWGLALANEHWKLPVGRTEQVKLTIDARPPMLATAKAVDVHGLLVLLENSDPVVDALRSGHRLTVSTKSGNYSFQLSGTKHAIALLAACVTENLQNEQEDNPSQDGQDAEDDSVVPDKSLEESASVMPNLR